MLTVSELNQDTANTPHVIIPAVRMAVKLFPAAVVCGSRLGARPTCVDDSGETEINDLDHAVLLRHHDVVRFDVAVLHLESVVQIFEGAAVCSTQRKRRNERKKKEKVGEREIEERSICMSVCVCVRVCVCAHVCVCCMQPCCILKCHASIQGRCSSTISIINVYAKVYACMYVYMYALSAVFKNAAMPAPE